VSPLRELLAAVMVATRYGTRVHKDVIFLQSHNGKGDVERFLVPSDQTDTTLLSVYMVNFFVRNRVKDPSSLSLSPFPYIETKDLRQKQRKNFI
jgi:hypothetical protein